MTNPRALEIGGGLGHTAYYAWRSSVTHYSTVDLPMTAVAQAGFLGRALGCDAISLFGENASPESACCRRLPFCNNPTITTSW